MPVSEGLGRSTTIVGARPRDCGAGRRCHVTYSLSNSRTVTGMRRILASAAAFGALAALLACGGGAVEPKTWTNQVCQALTPWWSEITTLNTQATDQMKTATTPAQAREDILRLLDGAQRSTETARSRVEAAGVPDVAGGREDAGRMVTALARMRDAYGKARQAIGALDTGRADAFYPGVVAAMDTLNREYAQAGVNRDNLGSAELRTDFGEAQACAASS
jgi:hypothetical protein